jgi:hypothetical protein
MRAPNYRAEVVGKDNTVSRVESGPIETYKGKLGGQPDSEARFTIEDDKIEGMILTGQDSYFVESARKFSVSADASDYVLYKASDVRPEFAQTCATLDEEIRAEGERIASGQVTSMAAAPNAFSPFKVVEIATEADFEYVSAAGGPAAANNEILGILNQVEGIYQRDVGMTFTVVLQHTWDTASDPYNTNGDAVAMINEFTNVWNASFTGTARDVAHLWTGRSLGGAAGIAWQGVVCRDGAHSYGVSIRETMAPFSVGIPAHEIGHNFGATHCDGVAGCDNSIMVATQFPSNTQTFCQFSINEITNFVNANSSCLTDFAGNPIDDAQFFVRQHYTDFFNRVPDQAGLDFWTNEITSCGTNPQCIVNKRVNVSAAFFLSIEFQQSGYLVERIYKTAFGDSSGTSTCCSGPGTHQIPVPIVRFNELVGDTSMITNGVIVGQTGWEQRLENNKQAYVSQFVASSRFTSAYPGTMTPPVFVQTLNQNAGSPLSPTELATLTAEHTAGTKNRAQVLRQIAEHPNLTNAEFNRAFVLMQYIGYLRRNPNDAPDADYTGYDFWLTKLNSFTQPGDDVLVRVQKADMVKAFIESGEYRHRFGP